MPIKLLVGFEGQEGLLASPYFHSRCLISQDANMTFNDELISNKENPAHPCRPSEQMVWPEETSRDWALESSRKFFKNMYLNFLGASWLI
jgi:hypothetical protein